jgi:hypothetical protein
VLLAFVAIATLQSYSADYAVVMEEAGYINNLYRDLRGFPPAVGGALRARIKVYIDTVRNVEWPVQAEGFVPTEGWKPLDQLHEQLLAFEPETRHEAVAQAEFLRNLNELYKARSARLTVADDHLP